MARALESFIILVKHASPISESAHCEYHQLALFQLDKEKP